ncbi:MAG: class I SAM-dependent methyltransferase [Rubrivivax sp.]|jgi:SAM-dependent methyltransferase
MDTFRTWEEAVTWLRAQPEQQELVLNAYYDDPLRSAAERYSQSLEWQAITALLPRTRGRALDVGAGRGIASYALAKIGFTVDALEPDSSAIVGAQAIRLLAKEAALPIEVTQDFSERLPFEDQSFDLIFARAVLHHTRDLSSACAEFFRVLRPGGRLIAVREHVISKPEDLPAFLESHPLHKLYGGENAFELPAYERALHGAGFGDLCTLAPFDSVINFAPHTLSSLQAEMALRAGRRLPGSAALLRTLLPPLWPLLRPLLNGVDNRPGRLYSFVAMRP